MVQVVLQTVQVVQALEEMLLHQCNMEDMLHTEVQYFIQHETVWAGMVVSINTTMEVTLITGAQAAEAAGQVQVDMVVLVLT